MKTNIYYLIPIIIIGFIGLVKIIHRRKIISKYNAFINFLYGDELPQEYIAQKFLNVKVILDIQRTERAEMLQIIDTSLYMKNQTIGITYFVQEQPPAQTPIIYPKCTVCRLKDGEWIWRPE